MGTVHDIIEARGKKAALEADLDRRVVEAAAQYMADEDSGIGFLYQPVDKMPPPHGWHNILRHIGALQPNLLWRSARPPI